MKRKLTPLKKVLLTDTRKLTQWDWKVALSCPLLIYKRAW